MRFQRVRLEKFKCYGEADLRLGPGVTVIHGLNGSGKSSLLEACFFALYGSKALDRTLDEVVTIGADDAEVELWFSHGGRDYRVERRVRATGEQAKTAKCVLETADATFEGARDVRAEIADLLRMDHEAFVNCAYVRQGEVNKLINASPSQRQDILDSLLQLGKLEEYRERASDARVGVGRVRDDKQGALSQVETQIGAKEDRDLHARLNELQSERAELDEEIEHVESQREQAAQTRDDAAEILEAYEQKQTELDDIDEKIETLREQVSETEREREKLADEISETRETRDGLEAAVADLLVETDLDADGADEVDQSAVTDRIDELRERDERLRGVIEEERVAATEHASRAENLRETASDLESTAVEGREEADALESEVEETRETLANRREKLDALDDRIAELREAFADAPVEFGEAESFREGVGEDLADVRERVASLETEVGTVREAIEEAEALLEAGKCPECGQDVEGAPHVESIDEDRAELTALEEDLESARGERGRLESRLERAEKLVEVESTVERTRNDRENVAQLIEERESTLEEKVEQVEQLREEAGERETEAQKKREAASKAESKADECRDRISELNDQRESLTERIDRLERVKTLLDDLDGAESELERLRERRDRLGETNDQRRERLAEKRDRRAELADEFDEENVEQARTERERAEQYVEKADEKLEALRKRRESVGQSIGAVTNEIEELESLRERRDDLAETVAGLDTLYEEAEQLQEMYGTLRAELRQRNVESLEAMLNEIFELVYQNDSYARIELSGEYELTVYQKDGETLDPDQLSGGERALFNLSLRCAIYRLLAEGIEGSAPMPPLILDEPTVFLDSGHVSQLVELVEAMGEYGVEQILVVSHDEELVGAADDLVRVRTDATTNRSTVERTDTIGDLAGAELDAEAD